MAKLGIKGSKNDDRKDKAKSLEAVAQTDDYLNGEIKKGRFDIDKRVFNSLSSLASATDDNGKRVTMRMILTEALIDVFDKYDRGEGKYEFDDKDMWNQLK